MSIKDLIDLAGVPGLSASVTLLTETYRALDNVKVHKQRCTDMSNRCINLLLVLRDSSKGLEGSGAIEAADEIESIVERVYAQVRKWGELNTLRSLIQQADIMEGIEKFNKDVDSAMTKFSISMSLRFAREHQDQKAIQERDNTQLREILQDIVKSQADLKTLMAMKPQDVDSVMQSLQKELHDSTLKPVQEHNFRRGLWKLLEGTSKLPPLIDLTGQVSNKSNYAMALGSYNEVYKGMWLDREEVALRLPRVLPHVPDFQKRFQSEVMIWRGLDHPNVQPLYGTVYIDGNTYSVSPWMDNGTAISYVRQHPDVDRLLILSQVASGMEYLHRQNIVHGDLRGANVLISKTGTARLSDFGLSKFLEEVGKGMSHSVGVNPRWFAPELIQQSGPVSTHSDVWSFGMLCLELMTGEQPYNHLSRDINVIRELDRGQTPERPGPLVTERGLSDNLWSLMQKCWYTTPGSRPSMTFIMSRIEQLRFPSPQSHQGSHMLHPVPPQPHVNRLSHRPVTAPTEATASTSRNRFNSLSFWKRNKSSHVDQITEEDHAEEVTHARQSSPISIRANSGPRRPSFCSGTRESRGGLTLSVTNESDASVYSVSPTHHRDVSRETLEVPLRGPHSLPTDWGTHFPHRRRQISEDEMTSPAPSVSSETSSMMRQAVTESAAIVYRSRDGSTTAGTLEGLVDRLINNSTLTQDVEFRDMFLACCTDFANPEDVLAIIVRRFHEKGLDIHPENQVVIRLNIMVVIKYWLSSHHLYVYPSLLNQMMEFAQAVLQMPDVAPTMQDKAMDILQAVHERNFYTNSPTLLSPGRKILKPSEVLPRDLAIGLTILEGDLYRRLLPEDYISHLRRRPGPNNIVAVSETNNKICHWVKTSILHPNTLDGRGNALKFFVNVAQECRKLRNFSSLSGIVTAIQSAPVTRLRLTRDELSPQAKRTLEKLSDLLDPHHHNRAYKAALNEFNDADSKDTCVPWIAIHLHELHNVFAQYPRVIDTKDGPLINFERYIKFTTRLKAVLPFKAPDLEQYRQQGQLAYLQHCLRGVRLDTNAEDALLARSLELEAKELKAYRLRQQELSALGFGVKAV